MPRLVLLPGASLMEMTPVAGGLNVRCPGCGAEQLFADGAVGTTSAAFVHADRCPVHRRIEQAIKRYERATVRRG